MSTTDATGTAMQLIVALVDFSEVTSHLVGLARDIAHAMHSRLLLLHVAMPDADFIGDKEREDESRDGIARQLRANHRSLQAMERDSKRSGIDSGSLMVRSDSVRGNPSEKILEEIKRLRPDLIVAGSHGRSRMFQLLIGNVTNAVLRRASCPVLVVPSRTS